MIYLYPFVCIYMYVYDEKVQIIYFILLGSFPVLVFVRRSLSSPVGDRNSEVPLHFVFELSLGPRMYAL